MKYKRLDRDVDYFDIWKSIDPRYRTMDTMEDQINMSEHERLLYCALELACTGYEEYGIYNEKTDPDYWIEVAKKKSNDEHQRDVS